ncbi:hypothetical protein [Staphylococcus phage vB_SauH_DELF3]|nr:hypothetical protein [Staphylococcus phage vB_SauH_DELF3]
MRVGEKLKIVTGVSLEEIDLLFKKVPVLRYSSPLVTKDHRVDRDGVHTDDGYSSLGKYGHFSFYPVYTYQRLLGKIESEPINSLQKFMGRLRKEGAES